MFSILAVYPGLSRSQLALPEKWVSPISPLHSGKKVDVPNLPEQNGSGTCLFVEELQRLAYFRQVRLEFRLNERLDAFDEGLVDFEVAFSELR